ncbi:hypothetical protein Hanom_Chr05g00455401 [Helianthus anomalus]
MVLYKGQSHNSSLQVLSFIFIPNFRRCHLPLKLMSFVLNVSKSYMLCPLAVTPLKFAVSSIHKRLF